MEVTVDDMRAWVERVGSDAQTTWITVRRYPEPAEEFLVGFPSLFPEEAVVEERESIELDGGGLPAAYEVRPVAYVLAWEGKSLSGHWRIFRIDDVQALREAGG